MAEPPLRHTLLQGLDPSTRLAVEPTEADLRQRLADIIRLVSDIVIETDRHLNIVYASPRTTDVLGYQPWDLMGRPLFAFGRFPHGGDDSPAPDWKRPFRDLPFRAAAKDGSVRHLLISALPIFDKESEGFVGVRMTAEDITRRKADEDRLRKLILAVEQSPASVMITDRDGIIEYVNGRFTTVTGYEPDDVIGRTPSILKSDRMPRGTYRDIWKAITNGKEWRGELYNLKKSGEGFWEYCVISPILDDDGTITHYLAVREDVTERKQFEDALLQQHNTDDVTGLPNRVLLIDRLEQAIARSRRSGQKGALLFLDLDHFKRVNDVIGHLAADSILKEVGQRLSTLMRPEDTVARMGGDEFAIIVEECDPTEVEGLGLRLLRGFTEPFTRTGHEIFVTPSVGMTIFLDDGDTAGELMRNADTAVFRAKELGRNTAQFFTPDMNDRAGERARLESALRHALDRGELAMHFQPMMDFASGKVCGAEALMRWTNPEFGRVTPDRFIPLAEATGLIIPMGEWALRTACHQAAVWCALYGSHFRIAVNVSTRQVRTAGFVDMVLDAIADAGIAPDNLEIEITESLLMEDGDGPADILVQLRTAGIRLSIDDFGTGYSSLSYLKRFPVDTLKIDRSFVSDLTNGSTDATLVEAIITMAHCLGLEVVAEGIETLGQFEALKTRSCDFAQGFLFGGAVPPEGFADVLPPDA